MIQITAPSNYIFRHINTKTIIGKNLYFSSWEQLERFELILIKGE